MNYWLFKSEPDEFSFDDLKQRKKKTEPWNGVRNYQARNFMRDGMKVGDLALFYHSNTAVPGIAGLVTITSAAYADPTQFASESDYFDPKSDPADPRWLMVDVTWQADFPNYVSLQQLKDDPRLTDLLILRRGNRLSVTPVEERHFKRICELGGVKS
jgi:predicted RNA-binding protein with PUA-like domain